MSDDDKEKALVVSKGALKGFSEDVGTLWSTQQIPVLDQAPSSFTFLRDYVLPSRPCIIRNAFLRDGNDLDEQNNDIPLTMTLDDLVSVDPDLELVVDVSPDGNADSLRCVRDSKDDDDGGSDNSKSNSIKSSASCPKRIFVVPEERRLSISQFKKQLRLSSREAKVPRKSPLNTVFPLAASGLSENRSDSSALEKQGRDNNNLESVLYYSRQNDCLRDDLSSLWERNIFPKNVPWAEQAFNAGPPDAINIWIGNERAVSAMHKDHYENLFYVLSGEKIFTLCPPADVFCLYERECQSGRFDSSKGRWKVVPNLDSDGKPSTVRWVAANVNEKENPAVLKEFPLLQYAHPLEVVVKTGDMLYLPALWFHSVTQSCETVGINYWYDMKFDSPQWCYFHFLQKLQPDDTSRNDDDNINIS